MMRRATWLALTVLACGTPRGMADDTVAPVFGEWESPDHRFIAQMSLAHPPADVQLTVEAKDPALKIVPFRQIFTSPFVPGLKPPCVGMWKADGTRFCLYLPSKMSDISVSFCTMQVALATPPPMYPTDKPLPQFGMTNTAWTGYSLDNDDLGDRIFSLFPAAGSRTFGPQAIKAVRWLENNEVEVDSCSDFTLGGPNEKAWRQIEVMQKAIYRMTADGVEPVSLSSVEIAATDERTKQATSFPLPRPTPVDELRKAARGGNLDKVKALLAEGVKPDAAQNATSPLEAALMRATLQRDAIVDALIKAGAKVGGDEICVALSSQSPDHWDLLLDAMTKADDDTVISVYDILFFGTPKGVKTKEGWLNAFQHVTDRLAQLGANFNARNEQTDNTPLIAAAGKPIPTSFIAILLKAGADPSLKNKASESAADVAANHFQIPALRILDRNQRYSNLLKQYNIPANSPFLGPWTEGGYIATITLNPDATGTFVSMFGGNVTWKQVGQTADIQIRVPTRSPEGDKVLTASGQLSTDGKTLLITFTGDTAKTLGATEQKFEKGPGDPH